jgi:hypothetical protein
MSRTLPPRPNLEHLKKQAKDLLGDLQRQDPESKLADALHAIAREYGFSSWPRLKAHVEALPGESGSAEAPVTANPFVGTWTANLSKSKRHPLNEFQSATLRFAMMGDAVTITHVGVDPSGREEHGEDTILADGKEHAAARDHGYVLVARWIGSHILEIVATKDGQIAGRGKYEVSPDGKTLTVSALDASANADGWRTDTDHVIVLDRE